jgi:cytochrome b561
MKNTLVESYSTGSKSLHWIVAILVLLMLSGSFFLDDLPEQYQATAYFIHKSTGLMILFLMLARLFWIVHTGKPELPFSVSRWERIFSNVVQVSFYVLLIAMPIIGWMGSVAANRVPSFFGLFDMPLYGIPVSKPLSHYLFKAHTVIAYILIALATLHICGALKHHFIDRDKILRRMLSNSRNRL